MSTTTTEHEVALFERADGSEYILVWIDEEATAKFADSFSEEEWQTAIEEHPFVTDKKLPVVVAFEDESGSPRLFGPGDLVDEITKDFDWENIKWGHSLSLTWPTTD